MDLSKPETFKKIMALNAKMSYREIIKEYGLDIEPDALRQRVGVFRRTGRIVESQKTANTIPREEMDILIKKGLNLSEAVLQVKQILGKNYTQRDIQNSCRVYGIKFKDGRRDRKSNKPPVSLSLVKSLISQKKTEEEIGIIIDRCLPKTRELIKEAQGNVVVEEDPIDYEFQEAKRKLLTSSWRKQA